jgi:hypothetical protein
MKKTLSDFVNLLDKIYEKEEQKYTSLSNILRWTVTTTIDTTDGVVMKKSNDLFIKRVYQKPVEYDKSDNKYVDDSIEFEYKIYGTRKDRVVETKYIKIAKYFGKSNQISIPERIDKIPITQIGRFSFANCVIANIAIPAHIEKIEQYAFEDSSAKTVSFVGDDVEIEYGVFNNCSKLTYITLPKEIKEIKNQIFSKCSSLKNINIPSEVNSIGDGAFWGCEKLTNITFDNKVTKINQNAFEDCTSLETITFSGKLEYPKNEKGEEDKNAYIGDFAFKGCEALTEIELPEGLIAIRDGAFEGCIALRNVTLPSTLEKIGSRAFNECTSLEKVYIPKILCEKFDDDFPKEKIKRI